ncbi:MAG: metallophosphoesterase [Kofleriaceae bacterium]
MTSCATTSCTRRSATTIARAAGAPPTATGSSSRCRRTRPTPSASTRSATRARGSWCSTPTRTASPSTDQTAWLERELVAARQDPAIDHIFVVMHHPPYSVSLHGGQRDLRERWTPLFERYGVAAVFSGHDHVYSRAVVGGVQYVVSGGGGAPLYPRSPRASAIDKEAVQTFERVNHYVRVRVHGPQIELAAIRIDGTVIEALAWGEAPPPAPPEVPEVPAVGGPVATPPLPMMPSVAAAPAAPSSSGEPLPWRWIGGGCVVLGLLAAVGVTRRR